MINLAYHVYDNEVSVQSGFTQFVDWNCPMLAMSVQIGAAIMTLVGMQFI
jgi:hypothetical protein